MSKSNVTSADVAREAGVSRGTVSNAFNGTASLSPATRQKVLDAATRLGYAPSAAARILRRGRSDLVVLVLPDWPIGYAAGRSIDLLSKGFALHGYPMVTYQMNPSVPDQWTKLWSSLTPAAVVALNPFPAADEGAMRSAGIHISTFVYPESTDGRPGQQDGALIVGRRQVQYLASMGHTHLGYATPTNDRLTWLSDYRLEGVRKACADLGLPDPVVQAVGTDIDKGSAATRCWRGRRPAVTAVAAYNDDVAAALLGGIRAAGFSCPQDLAVIGVDDSPTAKLTRPALTTVSIPLEAMAATLVRRTLVELGETHRATVQPAEDQLQVVVRESV